MHLPSRQIQGSTSQQGVSPGVSGEPIKQGRKGDLGGDDPTDLDRRVLLKLFTHSHASSAWGIPAECRTAEGCQIGAALKMGIENFFYQMI
jgi:hypothetical protein